MAGCPSGQWKRTVNPSLYSYAGSNPAPATNLGGRARRDQGASDLGVCLVEALLLCPASPAVGGCLGALVRIERLTGPLVELESNTQELKQKRKSLKRKLAKLHER